jgi:hypothetical protein
MTRIKQNWLLLHVQFFIQLLNYTLLASIINFRVTIYWIRKVKIRGEIKSNIEKRGDDFMWNGDFHKGHRKGAKSLSPCLPIGSCRNWWLPPSIASILITLFFFPKFIFILCPYIPSFIYVVIFTVKVLFKTFPS